MRHRQKTYTFTLHTGAFMTLVMLFFALPSVANAKGSIRFFSKSEVVTDRVVLSDVARVQGIRDAELKELLLNADLGPAPLPGRKKSLSKAMVISMLRRHGVPKNVKVVFPKSVVLKRPGQKLSPAKAEKLIFKALQDYVDSAENKLGDTKVQRPAWRREVVLPAGELEVKPSIRQGAQLMGLVTFKLDFEVNGEKALTRSISTRVDVRGEFCTTTRDIRRGEIITLSDVASESGLLEKGAMPCQEVVGMTPRSTLRAGKALRLVSLKPPVVVKRGQRVTIAYEQGALRITTTGEAKRDGAVGEWISVINTSSGTEVKARVRAPGKVNVY